MLHPIIFICCAASIHATCMSSIHAACMHVFDKYTCTSSYVSSYMPANMPAYMPAYVPAYMSSTNMHIYSTRYLSAATLCWFNRFSYSRHCAISLRVLTMLLRRTAILCMHTHTCAHALWCMYLYTYECSHQFVIC